MLLIFAFAAILSIFFPELLSRLANALGVGRGTDLVLYATIVSFFVFMATTYQRFRHAETSLTKLSRRIAIDEAPAPRGFRKVNAAGQQHACPTAGSSDRQNLEKQ